MHIYICTIMYIYDYTCINSTLTYTQREGHKCHSVIRHGLEVVKILIKAKNCVISWLQHLQMLGKFYFQTLLFQTVDAEISSLEKCDLTELCRQKRLSHGPEIPVGLLRTKEAICSCWKQRGNVKMTTMAQVSLQEIECVFLDFP